jgi:hypothetical protein
MVIERPKHVAAVRNNKTNNCRNCCGDGISNNPDYGTCALEKE